MARNRRGRNLKLNVERYACGKIKGETEVQIRSTVIAYRSRMVGTANAARNEAGYALGRMLLRGEVTERQHDAGNRYAQVVGDYQRCVGFPPPHPRSLDLGASRGLALGGSPDHETIQRVVNRYMASITALADAGQVSAAVVREVCVYDHETEMVEDLWRGLDALADFFKIPNEGVDERRGSA